MFLASLFLLVTHASEPTDSNVPTASADEPAASSDPAPELGLVAPPPPDLGPPLAGEFREGVAWFRVPVDRGQAYRWWTAAVVDPYLEHAWLIEFINSEGRFRFGFTLWNQGNQPVQIGDIDALLAAGDVGVWRVYSDGEMEILPELKVELNRGEAYLEIVLRDEATQELLLANRPMLFRIIQMQMREINAGHRVSQEVVRTAQMVYSDAPLSPSLATEPKDR